MGKRVWIAALTLAACGDIKQDAFVSQGGISPDPTAIFDGTVLYSGPQPRCEYDANGKPTRVIGRVALTLFEYTNPPPPEGSASSALNLLFVEGLFQTTDCPAFGAQPSPERVTRSVAFRWPAIELFAGAKDYQIRGFYDYDEDMIPFFSVSRLPTAGDVIGAALNDVRDSSKGIAKITLPAITDAEDGYIASGMTVVLGDVVRTERPAFALDANRFLSSESTFVPALGAMGLDPVGSLKQFRSATCATPGLDNCGLSIQPLPATLAPTLSADGVQMDLADPIASAFYTAPVDIKTVVAKSATNSGVDPPLPDGKVDPHPFLGAALGVPWYAPMVLLQRLPDPNVASIEAKARIPRVLMVGSVMLSDTLTPVQSSYVDTAMPVSLPPVAAAELVPGRADCRVPYFAPGTLSLVINGRLATCDELPTGRYAVNVLAGLAGGTQGTTAPGAGESPATFTGARYSGQSWTIPNELGDPTQVSQVVTGQALDETFVVQDPRPDMTAQCGAVTPAGLCADGLEIIESTVPSLLGADSFACLPKDCCEYVAHLCGVQRCAMQTLEGGANIASSPTKIVGTHANGAGIPDCVPFELPWQCCRDTF